MSSKRKPSRVAAEAIRSLSNELDEHHVLLEDIKQLLITLTDGMNQHRAHTIQAVNDLGERVQRLETRVLR